MKEKINFKKTLTTIGILSVVVPSSLSVVACGKTKNNPSPENDVLQPPSEIPIEVPKDDTEPPSEKPPSNETPIETPNEALSLNEVFKNFKLKDQRSIEGFLDSNDLSIVTQQVEEYTKKILDPESLVLENQTSNSIIVKNKNDLENSYNQVILTWNLKLFEVWGTEVPNASDINVRNGLKGYFYLDSLDQQIKFFDLAGYKNINNITINSNNEDEELSIFFINGNYINKTFLIYGSSLTSQLSELFNGFNFTNGIQTKFSENSVKYIKIFDKKLNQWNPLSKVTYAIDKLGNISWINSSLLF